jgi:hypothetical protein
MVLRAAHRLSGHICPASADEESKEPKLSLGKHAGQICPAANRRMSSLKRDARKAGRVKKLDDF